MLLPGYLNVYAQHEGWTCVAWDSVAIREGETHTVDLYLMKGGFIEGRVIDDATGEPVRPGAFSDVGLHGPARPRSGAAVEVAPIREDGTFRIRAAPGVNFPYLRAHEDWKVLGTPEHHAVELVQVEEGQTVEIEMRVRRRTDEELGSAWSPGM